ncbi:MAG: sugar transferase [Bacteroidota bacterium]
MSQRRTLVLIYLLADFMVSYGVWLFFVVLRRTVLENRDEALESQQFINAVVIASYWLAVYAIAGLYAKPFRRSRLDEFTQILKYTLMGVLIIFFSVFLDDRVPDYSKYRFTLTTYMSLQFSCVAFVRIIITSRTKSNIAKRKWGFPTLIVGCGPRALRIYEDLENRRRGLGYQFGGFVSASSCGHNLFFGKLKNFGSLERLSDIIRTRKIEEVIIALEESEQHLTNEVIKRCDQTNAYIKILPGIYDYLVGSVKANHILGEPLIEVYPQIIKPWEQVLKRTFDIFFALFALILLLPIYAVVAILIKMDSEGPVMFKQERIGKNGAPFFIYKFRSMYVDAEKHGPALSSDTDPRITKVGKVLRQLRLDELPQFWNVLKGDMSIVGPRPERTFFINQIVQRAPHYRHLHKVRPGITSWGQVKYGYAENVDEMIERLKFDILYLENMSFALDIRIIFYTLVVMVEGRGK